VSPFREAQSQATHGGVRYFLSLVTFSIIMAGLTVGINAEYENADVDPHPQVAAAAVAAVAVAAISLFGATTAEEAGAQLGRVPMVYERDH
jgi:hypothetical protein